MSRIDENGVIHPTNEDPISHEADVHIAFCPECSPYALKKARDLRVPVEGDRVQVVEDAKGDAAFYHRETGTVVYARPPEYIVNLDARGEGFEFFDGELEVVS